MVGYSLFKKSLKNLQVRNQYRKGLGQKASQQEVESAAESTIQRFEICYDCLWKVIRRHLAEKIGLPKVSTGPKPLARVAFENGLIADCDRWIKYINIRNHTVHHYDATKANDCLQLVDGFIDDAINLYQIMTGEKWE